MRRSSCVRGITLGVVSTVLALAVCACAGVSSPAASSGAAGGKAAPAASARARDDYRRQAADFVSKGDFDRAIDAYVRAEDTEALSALADKLLQDGSYDLFVRCWQEVRRTPVFQETFKDNTRGWNVRKDQWGVSQIQDGSLRVARTVGDNTSFFWTEGGIDTDRDFSIEAVITRTDGSLTHLVAVAWGVKDADTNFVFGISGDGSYLYGGYTGGKWKAKIEWKKSSVIRTGLAENRLQVRRRGATLNFFINDQLVDSAPYEAPTGTYVGISVGTPLSVKVSSYVVVQYPASSEPLALMGDAALSRGDVDAAVKYYAESGSTDRLEAVAGAAVDQGNYDAAARAFQAAGVSEARAHLNVAGLLVTAGKRAEALAEVQKAGWKLDQGFSRTVVNERFADNARDWAILDDKSAKLRISKGTYHVEALGSSTGRSTWNDFAYDPDAEFRIEARIRKISGSDKQTYSLIWGFTVSGEKQDFGVKGSGFEYGYFENGKWKVVLKQESNPAVHPGNAENVLAVAREGDQLGLYINGVRVAQTPFRPLRGNNVGFAVYDVMAIEVKSLQITEYPPEFALDLARTELFASRPDEFTRAVAAQGMERGQYDKALAAYLSIKDAAGAAQCELRLGQASAAAGDSAKAAEHFRKAGSSEEACRGLIAAYESLGQGDKADEPRATLANLLLADGSTDEAVALYRQLKKPALQESAAQRLLAAGRFAVAADLFHAAGNTVREKECYGRQADEAAKAGKIADAVALYRKAGVEAKAAALEKQLVGLAASPQMGDVRNDADTFGLRIVDSSGFSAEIGDPSWQGDSPRLQRGTQESDFTLSDVTKASFDSTKVSVSSSDGKTRTWEMSGVWGGRQLKGVVYQAGIPCEYEIDITNVKSMTRISVSEPAQGPAEPEAVHKDACQVTYAKGGGRIQLTDARLYYRGTFDSGYSQWGVGAGIPGATLLDHEALAIRLGKGTYRVPLSFISSISLKNKSFLTTTGFRCPFVGAPDLVAVAGQTPNGRVAVLPSAIDELAFTEAARASGAAAKGSEPPELKWSASGFRAGAATPYVGFSNVRSEVYSPAINREEPDASLAFRIAMEDYRESGIPDKEHNRMIWDKTFETRTVPIQVGQESRAVPFSIIKDLSMDSKGVLSISLRDGSVLRGSPYKNWKGLIGDSPQGVSRLALASLPARLAFEEPGKLYAMGLGITASMVESTQHLYGQRDYEDWQLSLRIENPTRVPVQFGKDILLMDCSRQGLFDGVYAAYAPGAPDRKPEMTDFDAESQAYALANFENRWTDGTMRGYRNGGTYFMGDPPDYHAEATICNSTLAPGAEVKVEKEFTQGSYVDPHTRVLVALPAVSSGSARFRIVLTFVKPDSSGTAWILDSAQAVRLTRDDLLASLKSAKDDPPLSVMALHWLADLDPAAAAPFIDKNICSPDRGLRQVSSIQLLANSRLRPSPEAMALIKDLAAKGGTDWSTLTAKRYLGAGK